MKTPVPFKRVIDGAVKLRVKADGSGADVGNARMSMNPSDGIAAQERSA